jgi:hypothetical protein
MPMNIFTFQRRITMKLAIASLLLASAAAFAPPSVQKAQVSISVGSE